MTDLSRYLLVDVSTGTCLTPSNCVLVHEDELSSSEWDNIEDWSDSEICELGRERGQHLSSLLAN